MSTLCHFKDPWQHGPSQGCEACGYLFPHAPGFLSSGQPGLTQLQLQLPTASCFCGCQDSRPQLWSISHSAKHTEPILCSRQGPRCPWGHLSLWGMECLPTIFPVLWALGSERTGLYRDSILYKLCDHEWVSHPLAPQLLWVQRIEYKCKTM